MQLDLVQWNMLKTISERNTISDAAETIEELGAFNDGAVLDFLITNGFVEHTRLAGGRTYNLTPTEQGWSAIEERTQIKQGPLTIQQYRTLGTTLMFSPKAVNGWTGTGDPYEHQTLEELEQMGYVLVRRYSPTQNSASRTTIEYNQLKRGDSCRWLWYCERGCTSLCETLYEAYWWNVCTSKGRCDRNRVPHSAYKSECYNCLERPNG